MAAIGASGCGIEDAIGIDSGILVDGNRTKAIKEGVVKLLAEKKRYRQGARAWAEAHSWTEIIKQLN